MMVAAPWIIPIEFGLDAGRDDLELEAA